MQLTVKLLGEDSRIQYEKFLAQKSNFAHLTFFHTWEWGELIATRALKFERLGIYDGVKLVAVGQFGLHKLKFGAFWYCPRGLVLDYANQELVRTAYGAIKDYFSERGGGFLRLDPDVLRGNPAEATIDTLGTKLAYVFTQAERVWIVELQKTAQQQLDWMMKHGARKNIPYSLRRAAKDGLTVRASDKPEDLEILLDLMRETSQRKGGIGMRPDAYYRQQFTLLAPKGYEKVFLAEYKGTVLAAALITIYGKEGSYLHAGSTNAERQLSAPHVLLFEAMKYIKANHPQATRFNFWGIVSDKNRTPSHPRHGYSEFKRSFGGYKQEYLRARDFVYNPLMWLIARQIDRYRTIKYKND